MYRSPPLPGVALSFLLLVLAGCARSGAPANPAPDPGGGGFAGDELAYLAQLPAAASAVNGEVRISPNELLQITVFEAPELSRPVRVSNEGEITMPLLGTLAVAGLTPRQLEEELTRRLRNGYMHDPQVTVEVTEARTASIYVLGEVTRAGAFPFTGAERMTVLQAISLGQGLRPHAAKHRTFVVRMNERGTRTKIPVHLGEVLAGRAVDTPLQPNDIVVVPKNHTRSFLTGAITALLGAITLRTAF